MNLHTHDYLAYRVNEVVIILDLGAMNVLCWFCRTIPVVHSCNHAMTSWNLKSLLAVNSKCSPSLNTCFQSVFTKTSCCRGAIFGKSLSFFGFNVVQPKALECGLGQITASLMTFFCFNVVQLTFFCFNVVQPWAGHFYWLSYCLYWTVAGQITSLFHVVQPWVRHF
jgi:hypothetical protein